MAKTIWSDTDRNWNANITMMLNFAYSKDIMPYSMPNKRIHGFQNGIRNMNTVCG